MHKLVTLTYVILLTALYPAAFAETTFEAFFSIEKEIEKEKVPVGYAIQRRQYDAKLKRNSITFYIKTVTDGQVSTSVTQSVSGEGFVPISSTFTSDEKGYSEIVKATFVSGKKTQVSTISDNKKTPSSESLKGNPGTFLSSFLFYIVDLASLKVGDENAYEAFSEEDGRYSVGNVKVLGEQTVAGQKILHLDDLFTGTSVENFIFVNGDPIAARSEFNKIETFITSKDQAVRNFEYSTKDLEKYFGRNLPEGRKNLLAESGGKIDARKIIDSFPYPKPNRQANAEKKPVITIKVPAPRK